MEHSATASTRRLDLERWRNAPFICMAAGGALALLGLLVNVRQFAFSWLLAFMFFLSLSLGALFLVLVHHLFDASWSVPIRRFCEHIAALLFPWFAILFIPIAFLRNTLYAWLTENPHADHALAAKQPLFTTGGFFLASAACFLCWWGLTNRLRYWSLRQDQTGEARATYRMRFFSGLGVVVYAITLTLGVVMWMKSLQWQWFSTMYGVYYFAGAAWTMLATAYVIVNILDRQGKVTEVLHEHQYYYLGSLMFAFTVFYAYIHFAQYFIIWNGNMPEETFWYVVRERGTWWWVGMVIIFGHFFVPFLALLRIDVKSVFPFMIPLCVWAWAMHWVDLSFNVLPVLSPNGYPILSIWVQLGCFLFIGGLLAWRFLTVLGRHPMYPIKDPRLLEAMGLHEPVAGRVTPGTTGGPGGAFPDAPPQFR